MDAATEFLNRLIGRWTLTGMMGKAPLRQSVACRWVLGHQFIQLDFKSTLPEPAGKQPYEAIYHIGYNAKHDLFVLHLLDTFGVGTECYVGLGKREGNSIPFLFDYPDRPFTNRFSWLEDTGEWVHDLTFREDEQDETFATKRMTRV